MGGMPIVYITDFGRYYDAFTCIMGMKSNGIATYCIMLRPYGLCLYVWLLSSPLGNGRGIVRFPARYWALRSRNILLRLNKPLRYGIIELNSVY